MQTVFWPFLLPPNTYLPSVEHCKLYSYHVRWMKDEEDGGVIVALSLSLTHFLINQYFCEKLLFIFLPTWNEKVVDPIHQIPFSLSVWKNQRGSGLFFCLAVCDTLCVLVEKHGRKKSCGNLHNFYERFSFRRELLQHRFRVQTILGWKRRLFFEDDFEAKHFNLNS